MKKLLCVSLTFWVFTSALAQQIDPQPYYVPIIGTGSLSCGQFMDYATQNNTQQMDLIVQWVWGFIAAYNARGNFQTKFKRPTVGNLSTMPDSPTVLLFLRSYCQKNALDTVIDGAVALTKAMGGQIDWRVDRK